MNDPQILLDAALRENFISFLRKAFETASGGDTLAPNWHHEAIAWQLERVRAVGNTRLIVTMPPRYLKSITISVAWVAWMLGRDPSMNFVCVSYSNDLSQKHAGDCRVIMQTDWYRRIFPNTVLPRGGSGEMDFRTTKGGGRLSTSVGGTLTGRGGDIIVIDDPIKPDEAMSEVTRKKVLNWYANTLSSRLNNKETGAIVLVMQRLHEEDLAGHLLEAGGWEHLSLPAIAETEERIAIGKNRSHMRQPGEALHPERENTARLEQLKKVMGSAVYSAQYQQAPVPAEGLYVRRDWLKRYETEPEKQPGDLIVQSWDTASKNGPLNDYSACITALVRKKQIYVLDAYRGKLLFPDLRRKVEALAKRFGADALLIEDAASGAQLIQQLRHDRPNCIPSPISRKPENDKITRFSAQSSRIEAGDLTLPHDAPWLAEFERELMGFPNVKNDDQVDALSQLLAWRRRKKSRIALFSEVIPLED
jgi:predicted phage terminase large subunit-like protein